MGRIGFEKKRREKSSLVHFWTIMRWQVKGVTVGFKNNQLDFDENLLDYPSERCVVMALTSLCLEKYAAPDTTAPRWHLIYHKPIS